MRIAYVCISHKPISRETTGGIETFTIYLLNGLQKLGCNVTLFAAAETDLSIFPGIKFVPSFSLSDLDKHEKEDFESKSFVLNYAMFQYAGIAKANQTNENYDILHYNCAQWYAPFVASDVKAKVLSTVHVNNLRQKPLEYLLHNFSVGYVANVSDSSSSLFQQYTKRRTIHNGIDLSVFPYSESNEGYFAWLGRIAPVKGLKEAIEAAKLSDQTLVASGPIDFPDYFDTEVKPILDDKRTIVEPKNFATKGAFLSKAKAVLMPIQWDEPFGLVAIEAMACGTPVIAFRKGGLAETIIDGVTGFLVDSVEEMAEKMKQVDSLDRKKCREHVEKYFSSDVMARHYLQYYTDIVNNS